MHPFCSCAENYLDVERTDADGEAQPFSVRKGRREKAWRDREYAPCLLAGWRQNNYVVPLTLSLFYPQIDGDSYFEVAQETNYFDMVARAGTDEEQAAKEAAAMLRAVEDTKKARKAQAKLEKQQAKEAKKAAKRASKSK